MMTSFEEAFKACNALADDLSALGVRFRIVLDDGDGMTAEFHSNPTPHRVPR